MKLNNLIIIGKFSIPYGIKGWIKLISFSEKKENIFFYKPLYIKNNTIIKKISIKNWEKKCNIFIVKIKNFDSRNEVDILKKKEILIKNESLPKLKNEYYWNDIINCKVLNKKNKYLGVVKKILETGSNDVLIIQKNIYNKSNIQNQEKMIPFIYKKIIKNVDTVNKIIMVDWNIHDV